MLTCSTLPKPLRGFDFDKIVDLVSYNPSGIDDRDISDFVGTVEFGSDPRPTDFVSRISLREASDSYMLDPGFYEDGVVWNYGHGFAVSNVWEDDHCWAVMFATNDCPDLHVVEFGNDECNQYLIAQQAEAVKQHLLAYFRSSDFVAVWK